MCEITDSHGACGLLDTHAIIQVRPGSSHGKWTYSQTRSRSLFFATDYAPQITIPVFAEYAAQPGFRFRKDQLYVCLGRVHVAIGPHTSSMWAKGR